jgi:hypothetical protein
MDCELLWQFAPIVARLRWLVDKTDGGHGIWILTPRFFSDGEDVGDGSIKQENIFNRTCNEELRIYNQA